MRSKVDLKNDLEISGVRNSLFSITKIEKIEERTVLGGTVLNMLFLLLLSTVLNIQKSQHSTSFLRSHN